MQENTRPCSEGFKECPGGQYCPTHPEEQNESVILAQQNRRMRERDNRFESDMTFREYQHEENIAVGVAVILFLALLLVIVIGFAPRLVR